MRSERKVLWGTRFGFYLAAVGSAFGLGNLWRFPYVAVENGGGVFVVLYIILALVVGLPLLLAELMLGKIQRSGVLLALKSDRVWPWAGRLATITCLLILSYYSVVSGWVLHFLAQFTLGSVSGGGFDVDRSLLVLKESAALQILLTSAHLMIALVVVLKGVQQGIERWIGNLMPLFIFLLIVLMTRSMSMPTSEEAVRFLIYPDFSKLQWDSLLSALGHALFTLSVGIGTMVTFGSYLQDDTHIPSAGFRVVALDTLISVFAGLLIFPLVIGSSDESPELLFRTLPRLLSDFETGTFFGVIFFLCLYFASLGATIGMMESLVSNLMDATRLRRSSASWVVGLVTLVFSSLPAFAYSSFRDHLIFGQSPLGLLDYIFVNVLLPLAAVGLCMSISNQLKSEKVRAEFINDDSQTTQKLFSHWVFAIRFVVPGVILVALGMAVFGLVLD